MSCSLFCQPLRERKKKNWRKKCFNIYLKIICRFSNHHRQIDMCQNRRHFQHIVCFTIIIRRYSWQLSHQANIFISLLLRLRNVTHWLSTARKANRKRGSVLIERNMTSIRFTDHHVIYCWLMFVLVFQIGFSSLWYPSHSARYKYSCWFVFTNRHRQSNERESRYRSESISVKIWSRFTH